MTSRRQGAVFIYSFEVRLHDARPAGGSHRVVLAILSIGQSEPVSKFISDFLAAFLVKKHRFLVVVGARRYCKSRTKILLRKENEGVRVLALKRPRTGTFSVCRRALMCCLSRRMCREVILSPEGGSKLTVFKNQVVAMSKSTR